MGSAEEGVKQFLTLGAHQGGHATARFLEGFLEGSLKEVLLRRVEGAL